MVASLGKQGWAARECEQVGDLQLEVQLVHAEGGSRVVLVQARRGSQVVDSALGEGATAEEAEDRARQRLQERRPAQATPATGNTRPTPQPEPKPEPKPEAEPEVDPRPAIRGDTTPSPQLPALPLPAMHTEPAEPPADPDDWSTELARLDLQLQRLGWDRAQEGTYLERVFGHPSRTRLTSYADLLTYLQALEGFATGEDAATAPAPLRRSELLGQCDQLLDQLRWDPGQGRAFLEQHFSLTSRQQLTNTQLLEFNMLLESEWLERAEASGAQFS